MATLDSRTLPTDALARRLAERLVRVYDAPAIADFARDGTIRLPDLLHVLAVLMAGRSWPGSGDEHGERADLRALTAYVAATGARGPVLGWTSDIDTSTVVPWGYGR